MRYGRAASIKTALVTTAALGAGFKPSDAAAERQATSCVLDPGTSCIVGDTYRHIYRVNVWYSGSDEIVIGAALSENGVGEWGEARNRSNNSSFVTLDSFCGECSYKAKAWNWGPGRHTVNVQWWW